MTDRAGAVAIACALAMALLGCSESSPRSTTTASATPGCTGGDCERMECFRPYQCARECGGETVMCGCCQCAPGYVDVLADCPRAEPTPAAAPAEVDDPGDLPCERDDECEVRLDSCSCRCFGRHREAPALTDAQRSEICGDRVPRNCGVQSPCARASSVCDPESQRCAVVR